MYGWVCVSYSLVEFTVWYLVRFYWKMHICQYWLFYSYMLLQRISIHPPTWDVSAYKWAFLGPAGTGGWVTMIISEYPNFHVVSSLQQCSVSLSHHVRARAMILLQMFGKWSEESDFSHGCVLHCFSCIWLFGIPPGSSVHGSLQAGTLEWVAVPSSRRSSKPRDRTLISCLLLWQAGSLPLAPPKKPVISPMDHQFSWFPPLQIPPIAKAPGWCFQFLFLAVVL